MKLKCSMEMYPIRFLSLSVQHLYRERDINSLSVTTVRLKQESSHGLQVRGGEWTLLQIMRIFTALRHQKCSACLLSSMASMDISGRKERWQSLPVLQRDSLYLPIMDLFQLKRFQFLTECGTAFSG